MAMVVHVIPDSDGGRGYHVVEVEANVTITIRKPENTDRFLAAT